MVLKSSVSGGAHGRCPRGGSGLKSPPRLQSPAACEVGPGSRSSTEVRPTCHRLRRRGTLLAFSDMSQVIYARVPEAVKSDVEEYADRQGVSLSSAAVDLLQRGLAAAGEERSIANLEG